MWSLVSFLDRKKADVCVRFTGLRERGHELLMN
jgi:hypothetical protein